MNANTKAAVALLFIVSAIASAEEPQPVKTSPDGFRGIKWKQHPPIGLVEVERDKSGDTIFYRRTSDRLSIGPVSLFSITYCFYKNQFYSVLVPFSAALPQNFDNLSTTMKATYGEPSYVDSVDGFLKWEFETAWVILTPYLSRSGGAGMLSMTFKPVEQQKKADREKAAKDAAGDL